MARYKSIIQLRGKIGDLVYRRNKGLNFVGLMTGPTAEKILTAPEFINTRKNMAEFGACANFVNTLYNSQDTRIINYSKKSKYAKRKIIKILMKLRKLDLINQWGQRTINANETMKGMILEKSGNFNFDFIKTNSQQIYISHGAIFYTIRMDNCNIINNVPDNSGKWYIKISIQLIQVSKVIFENGIYKNYREELKRFENLHNKTIQRNLNFSNFDILNSQLLKPVETQPIINNEDYFLGIMKKELLKKVGNVFVKTENYITTIEQCKTVI